MENLKKVEKLGKKKKKKLKKKKISNKNFKNWNTNLKIRIQI